MIYEPRVPSIEAERVLLSQHNLYAVAIDGKAHLVDAEVFDLLFGLAPGATKDVAVCQSKSSIADNLEMGRGAALAAEGKLKRHPSTNAPTEARAFFHKAQEHSARPVVKKPTDPPVWQRVLKILEEYGPLTHAEFSAHLYPSAGPIPSAVERKKASDCTYAIEADLCVVRV